MIGEPLAPDFRDRFGAIRNNCWVSLGDSLRASLRDSFGAGLWASLGAIRDNLAAIGVRLWTDLRASTRSPHDR